MQGAVAVDRPLDVLRSSTVPLEPLAELGDRPDLVVRERGRSGPGLGEREQPGATGPLVVAVLVRLGAYRAVDDLQRDLVDAMAVGSIK